MKVRLCYRIEKEAGWGEDENGNSTEVYSCIKINCTSYNIHKEQYRQLIELGKEMTSHSFKIDKNLITHITLNEYLDNTEEEE